MADEERQSGLSAVGDMKWGTHFCHFYETTQDLLDILVPFFQKGLESNEFCMWIAFDPLSAEHARSALLQAFPDAGRHLSAGNIEIIAHTQWYLLDGVFDTERVINGWKQRLNRALAGGYASMRVNGNGAWLTEQYRHDFARYEAQLDRMIANERMIVLCTYPLASSGGSEVFEIARNHQFAVAKRFGNWEVIESPEYKQSKRELQALSEQLEARVVERTRSLEEANALLRTASASLELAREEEGNRISREIHDQLGSALTALRWDLDELERSISTISAPDAVLALQDRVSTMQNLTDSTIQTARRIASQIRPPMLSDLGLIEAIEWQASDFQRRTGIECHVELPREGIPLSDQKSTAVFRILQEALTNILRHAEATRVSISIESGSGDFILNVRDNGKGVPESKLKFDSLGIWSMQERARLAGGTVNFVSIEGRGTGVTVRIPGGSA